MWNVAIRHRRKSGRQLHLPVSPKPNLHVPKVAQCIFPPHDQAAECSAEEFRFGLYAKNRILGKLNLQSHMANLELGVVMSYPKSPATATVGHESRPIARNVSVRAELSDSHAIWRNSEHGRLFFSGIDAGVDYPRVGRCGGNQRGSESKNT